MIPFKEFLKKIERKPKFDILNTVFGEHSKTPKKKFDILNTVFGKHSKTNKNIKEERDYDDKEGHIDLHNELVDHYNKYHVYKHKPAIHDYTQESKTLNRYLHARTIKPESTPINDSHEEHAKELKSALEQHKTPKDFYVFSGIKQSPEHIIKHQNGFRKKTGANVETSKFTSTSLAKHKAYDFSNHDENSKFNKSHKDESGNAPVHMLKIHIPKNHEGGYISHVSHHPRENEFLLPPKTKMHIHHVPEYDKHLHAMIWNAKVLPKD